MFYPLQITNFTDHLSLYIPDPEKVKPVYESLLAKDPTTPFPFWAKLWPAAYAMTAYLQQHPEYIQGKNVLEIGAGIGLPAFTVASAAASTLITDHAIEAIALMDKNIDYLGLTNTKAMWLDWNDVPAGLHADTILLSDVNYDPTQFDTLLDLIRRFVGEGSTVILATPQRITAGRFTTELNVYIRDTETMIKDGVDVGIVVLSLQ